MTLEGKPHLYHAPAQQDQTNGADQRKNKGGEIIYDCQRVTGSKDGC